MFNIGFQEILVITAATLLLFGAKRLPEVARTLGVGLRDFRSALSGVQREVTKPLEDPPPGATESPPIAPPSPAPGPAPAPAPAVCVPQKRQTSPSGAPDQGPGAGRTHPTPG